MFHFIAWSDGGKPGIDQAAWRKFCAAEPGVDLDKRWRRIRTAENDFMQDRAAMKRGDFTGIRGIPTQDMAMWETMEPIADRPRERLGTSDIAIIKFRQIMIEAARKFRDSGRVIGRDGACVPHVKLHSFEGIVPKSADWRSLGVEAEELASTAARPRVA
jgi:phthalate 4,5-dioxygenase oxygenase subunit